MRKIAKTVELLGLLAVLLGCGYSPATPKDAQVPDGLVLGDALVLAPDLAPVALDSRPADMGRFPDVAIPVDVTTAADLVRADALAVADLAPWGRTDDAGKLHCDGAWYNTLDVKLDLRACSATPGGALCWRVLPGTLPAPCRWGVEQPGEKLSAATWYVRDCAECATVEGSAR